MNVIVFIVMLYVFMLSVFGMFKMFTKMSLKAGIEDQKVKLNKLIQDYNENPNPLRFTFATIWLFFFVLRMVLVILTGIYIFSLI